MEAIWCLGLAVMVYLPVWVGLVGWGRTSNLIPLLTYCLVEAGLGSQKGGMVTEVGGVVSRELVLSLSTFHS